MTSRGHRQVRAADTANEERVAQAQPPVLGFGKWEELARKQKQLSKQQLSAMAQSKAIAVLDRNSYADGTWRRVFVVPKSRNFPGMAEVYDEHGQPLDEPNNGVAHGLQAQQAMMEEFGTEEYYRWPEVALASAEKKKPARLLPQLSPLPRPPGLPKTGELCRLRFHCWMRATALTQRTNPATKERRQSSGLGLHTQWGMRSWRQGWILTPRLPDTPS